MRVIEKINVVLERWSNKFEAFCQKRVIRINGLPMKPIEEYPPREQEKFRRLAHIFIEQFKLAGAVRKHEKEPTNEQQ